MKSIDLPPPTYPDVDDAGLVLRVEGDLEDVAEAGVEEAGVRADLDTPPAGPGYIDDREGVGEGGKNG